MNNTKRYTAKEMQDMARRFVVVKFSEEVSNMLEQAASTESQAIKLVNRLNDIADSWQFTATRRWDEDEYSAGRQQVAQHVIEEIREAISEFKDKL